MTKTLKTEFMIGTHVEFTGDRAEEAVLEFDEAMRAAERAAFAFRADGEEEIAAKMKLPERIAKQFDVSVKVVQDF